MTEQANVTGAVARTVLSLRTERGWSLDQLASRSGVSKGVLVALEQGRSNPNLATLARLADAFGVPVSRLVEVADDPAVRVTGPAAHRQLWTGPDGGAGTIVGATDPPWAAELWRFVLMPGEGFGGDAHAPATRELVWIERGTVTLTVAGVQHRLDAGSSARFPGGLPHRYGNDGTGRAEFTMVVVVPPAPA